jgi:hypothetical protein
VAGHPRPPFPVVLKVTDVATADRELEAQQRLCAGDVSPPILAVDSVEFHAQISSRVVPYDKSK